MITRHPRPGLPRNDAIGDRRGAGLRRLAVALALLLLPQAAAADDLPDPLDLLADIRRAMLDFDPDGAAIFTTMPAGPAWVWAPTTAGLLQFDTARPDPWAWTGSAMGALVPDAPADMADVLPGMLDCARNGVAAAREVDPDSAVLIAAADALVIQYCSVTLPVAADTTLADYDRFVAALRGDFATVEVLRTGADDIDQSLLAEGGTRTGGAVIDSVIVRLFPPGPRGPTAMMTVSVTSLLFPTGS